MTGIMRLLGLRWKPIHRLRLQKMLSSFWLCIILFGLPIVGQVVFGPQYKTYKRPCDSDSDCNRQAGEVCLRLYNGCYSGVCMCNPATYIQLASGTCKSYKLGNEPCRSEDDCLESMSCYNGTCQCLNGAMTRSGAFCVMYHQRLLGQSCNPSRHTCYHYTQDEGYSTDDVWCSHRGTCECAEGFRQYGESCRRLSIGDIGCTRQYHCEGGAICLDRKCVCPNGYRAVAKNTKCASISAITDLSLEAQCDEINEERYCSHGLICHKCSKSDTYKCVQYLLFHPELAYVHSGGSRMKLSICHLSLMFSCLNLVYLWMSSYLEHHVHR